MKAKTRTRSASSSPRRSCVRLTGKQREFLYRLIDTYVDAAVETAENRSDLEMAKRIRRRIVE